MTNQEVAPIRWRTTMKSYKTITPQKWSRSLSSGSNFCALTGKIMCFESVVTILLCGRSGVHTVELRLYYSSKGIRRGN